MIRLAKSMYDKDVLLKSAFALSDEAYFHFDVDNEYYMVEICLKNGNVLSDIDKRFEKELIAQQTRKIVSQNTQNIRELIVARALSSTLVNTGGSEEETAEDFSAEDILKDWFEK